MVNSFEDSLGPWSCPGPAGPKNPHFTRSPGRVTGARKGEPLTMEWQWAQSAMFMYYYVDMRRLYPDSFIIAEREFVTTSFGVDAVDRLLRTMSAEFRNFRKANGGLLRPDIMGLFASNLRAGRASGVDVIVELLEVSTEKELKNTFEQDLLHKLGLLGRLVRAYDSATKQAFSSTQASYLVRPSQWKPSGLQKFVPLPPVLNKSGKTERVEWICFNPTFRVNQPHGVDGLLLYEIHSVPLPDFDKKRFEAVAKAFERNEREARRRQQVAATLLPLPWLSQKQIPGLFTQEEIALILLMVGIAGLIAFAYLAAPAVAALSFTEIAAGGATALAEGAGPAAGALGSGAEAVESAETVAEIIELTPLQMDKAAAILFIINQTAKQWNSTFESYQESRR